MSHRQGHRESCARAEDLGCTASFPAGKFDAIRASEAGWFRSREEHKWFCPEHVPDWVPAWRASLASRRKVVKTYDRMPAVAVCLDPGCGWAASAGADDAELAQLREEAFQHARGQVHKVTVTTSQVLTLEPSPVVPA